MAPRLMHCFGKSGTKKDLTEKPIKVHTSSASPESGGGSVLVELFTSQGCRTSPEAELLISRIGRGDFPEEGPVIVLAYHVEYWDYLGWKDPFGSSMWTVRQKAYVESLQKDTIYTPQVVIQGRTECLGTNEDDLMKEIRNAPRFPGPMMLATFSRQGDMLQVSLSGALRTKIDGKGADVMVALYESGLVTNCTKGENKDHVLTNDYVVKKLEKLTNVRDISAKKTVSGSVSFTVWEGFNSNKSGLVVFIQNPQMQSLGSQLLQLPEGI